MQKSQLDLNDRKILYELDKNARISCSQLGKKIGLSKEVANYRIKKLEEFGIIKQYHTLVNYSKLGVIHFKICLKYNGISLEEEEKIYLELKKIKEIIWIAKCQGKWDCMISCNAKDFIQLDSIKDKILSISSSYLRDKALSITSEVFTIPRSYLINKKSKSSFPMGGQQVKLDELDLKILRVLSENARKPVVEIVNELNSTVKIITYRIRKMLKEGVISNFRLVLNYEKLGLYFYKTLFYLKKPEEKRLRQLTNYLNSNQNVIHNMKVIGDWDLEPEFEFENERDFQNIIQNIMNEYSDIIQNIEVINVLREYKYTLFYK